jgi:glycosyltransferase involved in cell wall biosynthesis
MVFKDLPKPALILLNFAIRVLVPFQVLLLWVSYYLFAVVFLVINTESRKRRVAIGVTEAARLLYSLGRVFPSRYICVLDASRFYKDDYDFGPFHVLTRPFVGPVMLAYLAHLCDTFMFTSFTGYLADRQYDFRFLKNRGKKIVLLFYGSDIRSLPLTKKFFDERGEDTFVNYLPNLKNQLYDDMIRQTAAAADKYADLIFNWNYDQIGYLKSPSIPWPYMVDLEAFPFSFSAPREGEKLRVLHCPSHTIVKGTPMVRAAVKQLKSEGFDFDYIELQGVPNSEVLEQLKRSHIVLQEFFCLTPGILGLEALAFGNAVLMSANTNMNPELPEGSDDAWIPTLSWQLSDKLRMLLKNPEMIGDYAQRGRKYVERYFVLPKAQEVYLKAFRDRGIPF